MVTGAVLIKKKHEHITKNHPSVSCALFQALWSHVRMAVHFPGRCQIYMFFQSSCITSDHKCEYQPFSPLTNNLLYHLPFQEPLSFEITITHFSLSLSPKNTSSHKYNNADYLDNNTIRQQWRGAALYKKHTVSASSDRFSFTSGSECCSIITSAIKRLLSPANGWISLMALSGWDCSDPTEHRRLH